MASGLMVIRIRHEFGHIFLERQMVKVDRAEDGAYVAKWKVYGEGAQHPIFYPPLADKGGITQ